MNATVNRQFRLAARPVGLPKASDWTLVEKPVPQPGEGEFLVRIEYISLDPAMRGWMNEGKSYVPPVGIGEVMRAGAAGEVAASNHPGFPVGSKVSGLFGVQEYALSNGKGVHVVDTALAPLPTYLSVLGMTGMTAYFGLLDVGEPKAGDTVVVSGAAGAVGTVVGEVYAISTTLEVVLDAIEEVYPQATGEYTKRSIHVLAAGRSWECIVYEINPLRTAGLPVVASGDWVISR